MKRSEAQSGERSGDLAGKWAAVLLAITILLVLIAGWHREIAARYPVSDFPYVDGQRIMKQVQSGNVGKTGALYYRRDHAGADTSEVR